MNLQKLKYRVRKEKALVHHNQQVTFFVAGTKKHKSFRLLLCENIIH